MSGGVGRARRVLSDRLDPPALWRERARLLGGGGPGRARVKGLEVEYEDRLSYYMEYKDLFVRRVYAFPAAQPAPRVLDGGSYIGMAALFFARTHPDARITCFEPDPGALRLLRRNLAANGVAAEVVEAGLGARHGTAGFAAGPSDGGRVVGDGGAQQVRLVPLADYLNEPVDFLKLNIEGLERTVLEAAADRLRAVERMVIEYHGWPEGPQDLGAILTLLDDRGFRYLLNHIDYETNSSVRPPFALPADRPWFSLIYAERR